MKYLQKREINYMSSLLENVKTGENNCNYDTKETYYNWRNQMTLKNIPEYLMVEIRRHWKYMLLSKYPDNSERINKLRCLEEVSRFYNYLEEDLISSAKEYIEASNRQKEMRL